MNEWVEFEVVAPRGKDGKPGWPRPAGSKHSWALVEKETGKPRRTKQGKIAVATRDMSGQGGTDWKKAVREAGEEAMLAADAVPLTGACEVRVVFFMPRPKAHYGAGKRDRILKESAPATPYGGNRADLDKMSRSVLDALKGVTWRDDTLIVEKQVSKRFRHHWEDGGARIAVRPAEFQTVGDLLMAGVNEVPVPEFEPTLF